MIDSRLLRKDTLSSVIIGVVPRRSDKEVCGVFSGDFVYISVVFSPCFKVVRVFRDHDLHVRRKYVIMLNHDFLLSGVTSILALSDKNEFAKI